MKKVILIFIGILVIIGAVGVYKYTHKPELKPPTFDSEVDRQEHIKGFVSQEQGTDPNHEITENAGGFNDVNIQNRGALMKFGNPDIMISVDRNISNAIKSLPQIVKDTKDLKDTELENYFNGNQASIISILGIDNKNDFKVFIGNLSFIKDGSKITEATIDESTPTMETNILTFKLKLKASNNKEQIFNIKNIITAKDSKADSVTYWIK
jgi:hypothetical protein